jgi:rod shape-determining protein MreD
MRRGLGVLLMVTAALVQVTWAPRLEIAGAYPNLVLAAVVAITWTLGARSALAWACVGGVLCDLTSSGPIGPHALALLVGVYVIGLWIRNLERVTALRVAASAAVATCLYSAVLVLADDMLGLPVAPFGVAVQLTLAAAAYNALLAPFVFEVARRLHGALRTAPQPA